MMATIFRWGYPPLLAYYPEISSYYPYLLSAFIMVSALTPAMAMAFILLEEKDNALFPVFNILPYSFRKIISIRMLLLSALAILSALLIQLLSPGPRLPLGIMLISILLSSGMAPLFCLSIALIARNKIEGATIAKAMNFAVLLPLPALLYPSWWSYFAWPLPTFWIFKLFLSFFEGNYMPYAIIALPLLYFIYAILINKKIRQTGLS